MISGGDEGSVHSSCLIDVFLLLMMVDRTCVNCSAIRRQTGRLGRNPRVLWRRHQRVFQFLMLIDFSVVYLAWCFGCGYGFRRLYIDNMDNFDCTLASMDCTISEWAY